MLGLADLAVILIALTVGSVAAGRMKVSAIPLFIIGGVLLGPGTPIGVTPVHGTRGIEIISELGVILLLFFLGLEFSLDRITSARRLVFTGGLVDLGVNGALGALVGWALFGVSISAMLFAGLFYVTSSGVVTQSLIDLERLGDDETDLTLGILVFEDLAIALFLSVAGALAAGHGVSLAQVGLNGVLALVFIGGLLAASRYAGRFIGPVVRRLTPEQLFLFAIAVAVSAAWAAEGTHLSAPVGALLAGVLLSGTEIREEIERELLGMRDFAAAVFFLAFGLGVDLSAIGDLWAWVALAVPAAIAGKVATGLVAGRLTGFTRRQSLNAGAALVARGEFTIILAGMAAAGAAVDDRFRDHVAAFAGIFVLITAGAGVLLMRESRRIGRLVFPGAPAARRRRSGAQRHG
ncbi:MAG: cation:proton antiporter [Thermoleophilia bacterium]|nr:cation:proton antiporter [Thermoleophilia bacterium]